MTDVIVAETVYVLESVYKASRETIVTALRAMFSMRSITVERAQIVQRGIDLYEAQRMDFADAYLVAFAEANGVAQIASFDRGIDKAVGKASTVKRLDPRSTTS